MEVLVLLNLVAVIAIPLAVFRLGTIVRRGLDDHNEGMRAIFEQISQMNRP